MKKTLKAVALFCITVALLLSTVSCAWINETLLGKEHEHEFKKPTQTVAPTCVAEGKQIATCKCGALEITMLPATGEHTYQNEVCTVCGRKDSTGLSEPLLCGDALSSYVIVYDKDASDYTVRAAEYIAKEVLARTNISLPVVPLEDSTDMNAHEIVVGETARPISQSLDAQTEGFEFAVLADENHVAIEADYFIIAAAAYYFVERYIPEAIFDIEIPKTVSVCTPIVKKTENAILLIGDGMGPNQTKLFDAYKENPIADYSDGEDFFYGYLFPHIGKAKTNSLSGITDSAASGTALASGYKTKNGYVGKDSDRKDIPSLTELAAQKGMATAVMSTETQTGATPAAFSAHANDRSNTGVIRKTQTALAEQYGTIISCDYNVYTESEMSKLRNAITDTLETLSKDEDGFFMMYEEAYIDKHCHNNDAKDAYLAMVRFNQAIALFMEYAFYNPETMVIITADHETGGLQIDENGEFKYTSEDHTSTDVPVFAYGAYSEAFDEKTIENVQIPKTIAAMFGIKIEGTDLKKYPALLPIMETNKE
ncbi:MAG: alkaline phosphatase [Ruminococcaceae bacterium]|nr:alkaline phosphatase [Oscillospiraceae bacterium]